MRRALMMGVGVVAVTLLGCRTTQPPGTENAQPIQQGTDSQQGQIMPADPPGPTGPMNVPQTEERKPPDSN